LAIYFAVSGQWQGIKYNKGRRKHVSRQFLLQVSPELNGGYCWLPPSEHDIGHQSLVTKWIVPGYNNAVTYCRVTAKCCLDLLKLYAKPADLDLIVDPSQKLDVAIGKVTSLVSGPV
jgi:hypothetical protein